MHRIDVPSATVDEKFTDGSPTGGIPATIVPADWLNDLQENVAKAVEAAGITLVKGDYDQLTQAINTLAVGIKGVQQITAPGITTFVVPSGVTQIWAEVIGGAGGGAYIASGPGPSGGGGGGIARRLCTVTPGQSITCTVGAGGIGGATLGSVGGNGGASSFGSFCSATAGFGGRIDGSVGGGGTGTGGYFAGSIGRGGPALRSAAGTDMVGGAGGGNESQAAASDASVPTQPGMGGGGRTTGPGAPGAPGSIILKW